MVIRIDKNIVFHLILTVFPKYFQFIKIISKITFLLYDKFSFVIHLISYQISKCVTSEIEPNIYFWG